MSQFEVLLQAIEGNVPVQTITLIAGPIKQKNQIGQMLLVFGPDRVEGTILDDRFTEEIVEQLRNREWTAPCIINLTYQQAEYQVFWDQVGNEKKQAVVFGGGHISQPLVQILGILDYEVTVVDDRLEFANAERFPGAQRVICNSFVNVLQEIEINDQTAVIIVTRGHKYDLDCLRSMIGTQAGYIGMIGSRRKVWATLEVLQQEGISQHLLDRVHAPIGLDLGGQSPGEIAVSIAAEVVAAFKGGSFLPLSRLAKEVHHG